MYVYSSKWNVTSQIGPFFRARLTRDNPRKNFSYISCAPPYMKVFFVSLSASSAVAYVVLLHQLPSFGLSDRLLEQTATHSIMSTCDVFSGYCTEARGGFCLQLSKLCTAKMVPTLATLSNTLEFIWPGAQCCPEFGVALLRLCPSCARRRRVHYLLCGSGECGLSIMLAHWWAYSKAKPH